MTDDVKTSKIDALALLDEASRFIQGFAASSDSGFVRQRAALDWMQRYAWYVKQKRAHETISRPTPFSDQQSDAGLVNQELQDAMLNPATQVMFRAGLLAAREYMAAFVEAESPSIAASIRANWWPSLGDDPGRPRRLHWDDVYLGEYPDGRAKTKEEVSPSTEALVQAAVFLMKHCGWPLSHTCFGEERAVEKTSTPPAEREGRLRCTACGGVGLHEPGCRSGTCDCRCHTSSGPETRSICPHCHHPMGDFK